MFRHSLRGFVIPVVVFVVAVLVAGAVFLYGNFGRQVEPTFSPTVQSPKGESTLPVLPPASSSSLPQTKVLHDVPFVSQAPTGNWDDPRQQDGCEEAASLMSMLWVKGEKTPTTPQEKETQLLAISQFQSSKYGTYHDTSAQDTVERILKGYFDYHNVDVVYDITTEDIKQELYNGNLIIVPADGQKLGNPYFTQPGPERHMLVVRGYDPGRDEFITNDNGTRRGEGYRYKAGVLMSAIRDYPTGDHQPILEVRRAMIVIKPNM